jgi:flap endonuclease-1
MGVQIAEILPKKPILLKELEGKKIAIDAFNWIYQFLSIIRDRETGEPLKDSKGRITSHLSGLFYRTAKIMEAGVKPVYIIDGPAPAFKYATAERNQIKLEAERRLYLAREKGDKEEIRIAAQLSSRLTGEMIEQSKNLLTYMGIPVFQAPSEAEAQCAFLCKEKLVYSTASQDSDSLLFGSLRLIRNLNITGKRKLPKRNIFIDINPELIELKEVLNHMKLTREQLIIVGILVGTDYNPGIKGIGPKRALELVKTEKTLEKVLGKVEWNIETPAEKIYNFYVNPPVKNFDIRFVEINEDKILKMMVDEHEFSQTRIEKVIKTLKEHQTRQKNLDSWTK